MTAEQYRHMADKFRAHPGRVRAIRIINRVITGLTMASYPLLLCYLLARGDALRLYQSILVPAVAFVVVSVFRYFYNAPRPYERMEIEPLIPKDTRGKSFPSRHVFSIFMIGMTYLPVVPAAAVLIFVAGVLLAVLRVIGGVHDISDVVAGAAIGILCGILGYYVIF